ncbi:hypothetical protein F5Y13DRAFT_204860 [Hypoxylon sp. FL1857]|nr:hypothetical protein F5Y13DRAFT_204860 [Hypoxylon sp. FL1857]
MPSTGYEGHGTWLASKGAYQDRSRASCYSDPRLKYRENNATLHQIPWPNRSPRIKAMKYANDGFAKTVADIHPTKLDGFIRECRGQQHSEAEGSLYIIESLDPDVIATLGHHFDIDPTVFMEQNTFRSGTRVSILPSLQRATGCLRLTYTELLALPPQALNNFHLLCSDSGRHIRVSRSYGQFSRVGMVLCKCSVLTRKRPSGNGWDCIVLCDPRVRTIRGEEPLPTFDVGSDPVDGGYVDFVPNGESHLSPGPPRTNMMDDLCFYMQNHSDLLPGQGPEAILLFVKKIIASHYLVLLNHLDLHAGNVTRRMERHSDLSDFDVLDVESQWSDAQAYRRRVHLFCEILESDMIQMGIPFETPNLNLNESDWMETIVDFQYLHMRFRQLASLTETLGEALNGLASVAGNRQALQTAHRSVKEARSAKALTFVGLAFIPLAYTASLFSMADPYGPGNERFWVYFAISLPLVVFVILAYYTLDLGYKPDNTNWSMNTLIVTVTSAWKGGRLS